MSMEDREKVFGVGMMKTGTSTLGRCLTIMGYRHRAYYPKLIRQIARGDFSYAWDVAERYQSFEDNPWPMIFREIDERWENARFVLTVRRDSETWFRSLMNHAKRMGPTAERKIIYGYAWPGNRAAEHIAQYEAHNREVRNHFAGRPGKLLEVCWETGSSPLDVASFLGQEFPGGREAPRVNRGASQSISPRFWLRNTAKYLLISVLRYDPFIYRGFDA